MGFRGLCFFTSVSLFFMPIGAKWLTRHSVCGIVALKWRGLGLSVESYAKDILAMRTELNRLKMKPREYKKDEVVIQALADYYHLCWLEIHTVLAPKDNEESELKIRQYIRDLLVVAMPIIQQKIKYLEMQIDNLSKYKNRTMYQATLDDWFKCLDKYYVLYENVYALAAFRSLIHFANFLEWDLADKDKVWKHSIDPNGDGGWTGVNYPFFYYFNKMAVAKDIKFMSKQYPTGYGKSYSNVVAISWLLGINPNNDCLLVLGNPALVLNNTKGVCDVLCSKRYAKVFPAFQKYHDEATDSKTIKDKVFSVCRTKEGELTLAHSRRTVNLKVISKDTAVDGIRVRYLFLDDVCRSKDAGNNKQHEIDIANYWNSWWKRNYNTEDFYVVVGGTAYSIYDVLSTLKNYYAQGKVKRSSVNKYTTLSIDEKCVFISIPKLDPETDESTYPQKFPTIEARRIRERNYRDFMAMEQQMPQPPETSPFYWDNLKTYDAIPQERSQFCWAAIDPVRVGGDNFAMPIFVQAGDLYYLKDCIYQAVEQERIYSTIVAKIVQHHITQLVVERNTDTSLKRLLDDMLKQQGVFYCNIVEVYNYEKKEVRITNMQNTIKTQLVFPNQHIYGFASEMGRFMYDIVSFSWDLSKNKHDDSIDATTMFCEAFLNSKKQMYATVGTFAR